MTPISERLQTTVEDFASIRRAGEPVVMRGLTADWPLVQAARRGEAAEALKDMAGTGPVPFMRAPPEIEGRLHYGGAVEGENFSRGETSLAEFIDQLTTEAGKAAPDSLALQGMPARERMPGFEASHRMPLAPAGVGPRLWIGNAAKVAAHHDPAENIAVVAAGRRRFTLFAPEQVGNLYMGPFHQTPAGVQVSLAHVTAPDFERFPRFREALDAALVAELEPGDAIYIPFQWYHHVEALEPLNVLVNYWWDPAPAGAGSPWDAMMHGLMSLRTLPPDQRRAWKAMFDHYVFETNGDPAEHLPEEGRGILARPNAQTLARMRQALRDKLNRDG